MATGVSQILAKTAAMVKERFGSLLGLWAAFFGFQIILFLILGLAVGASAASSFASGNPEALGAGMIVTMIVFYLIYVLVYFAQSGALNTMASPLHRPTFGEAINAGARSAPTMLAVVVIFLVAYFLAALVIGLVAAALAALGTAATVLVAVLIVPAAVYLICRLSLVGAVVPIERIGNPITAIKRTWSLTRSHALTIFLVLLVCVVVAVLLFGAVFYPFYSSLTASATSGEPPNFAGLGFFFVGILVVSILFSILFSALFASMHAELAGSTGEDMSEVFA